MKTILILSYMKNRYSPETHFISDEGYPKSCVGRFSQGNFDNMFDDGYFQVLPLDEKIRRGSQYVRRIKRREQASKRRTGDSN